MNVIHFDDTSLGEPIVRKPAAERVLSGDPVFRTWEIVSAAAADMRVGYWDATPGAYSSSKGAEWEYCHILEGEAIITEEGMAPVTVRAGDMFVMKPGFRGTWTVTETIRKLWIKRA